MSNPVSFIDIPVKRLDRAMRFYSAVLEREATREDFPTLSIALLAHDEGEVAICLFPAAPDTESNQPSDRGPLIYLNCEGRLNEALEAVEQNGGAVIRAKHSIGANGWRAIVMDSEGNRIALHSHET